MNKVTLGGIVFDPGPRREIRLGGNQALVKQDVPGVGAIYQDMGPDEEQITWSGSLVGPHAVLAATALDAMRKRGGVVELQTWQVPMQRVRIREFTWRLIRQDRVDYDLALVAQGNTPDFTPPPEAAEAADGAPVTTSSTSATHAVAAGDTLWAIAECYMGDGSLWPAIAAANGITDPAALQIGQVLTVPTASEAPTLAAQHQSAITRRNRLLVPIAGDMLQPQALPE